MATVGIKGINNKQPVHTRCWLGLMQKAVGSTLISSLPTGLLQAKSDNNTKQESQLLQTDYANTGLA